MNVRTDYGRGRSPLNLAKYELGLPHPITLLLETWGAEDIEPEVIDEDNDDNDDEEEDIAADGDDEEQEEEEAEEEEDAEDEIHQSVS